jgi:hypothetical protein
MTAMNEPDLNAATLAKARRDRRLLLGLTVAFIVLPLLLFLLVR